MKLTKEDIDLLKTDKVAFLVKAYLSIDDTPSTRECASILGISHSTCYRLMSRLGGGKSGGVRNKSETPFETANETHSETQKPRRAKGSKAVSETANETPFETQNETLLKQQKPPKEASSMALYKQVFEDKYRELTGVDFYWEPKQVKALKDLVEKKIAFGMRSKGNDPTPSALTDNLKLLLGIISDPWILKNYTPAIINGKYSEIIATHNSNARRTATTDRERKQADLQDFRTALDDKRKEYGL